MENTMTYLTLLLRRAVGVGVVAGLLCGLTLLFVLPLFMRIGP